MTRGSHRPSLLTQVRRAAREDRLFEPGERVLVACSGGPDSSALLSALGMAARELGIQVFACGVDHGLRAAAAAELALAARLAAGYDVPFQTVRVDLESGSNLQARARQVRFDALERVAREVGATAIATGHTLDDRAETVLIRLLRGAGPGGLAVLAPREGARVRPLIRCSRADVHLHLKRHRIPFSEDPSNHDPRFLRTRVRAELRPLLQALSPRIDEHLARLAEELYAQPRRARGEPAPRDTLSARQRAQLERAGKCGRRGIWVRLRGGRDAWLETEPPARNSAFYAEGLPSRQTVLTDPKRKKAAPKRQSTLPEGDGMLSNEHPQSAESDLEVSMVATLVGSAPPSDGEEDT